MWGMAGIKEVRVENLITSQRHGVSVRNSAEEKVTACLVDVLPTALHMFLLRMECYDERYLDAKLPWLQ